jgi:EAL domain-containing protein (putative c-di-GMP-specific phosphodiesterase class I)
MNAGQLRVLVIDDEPEVARMLRRACELSGYLTESTTSPEEFRRLALTRPDFLIMDLMMPGTDGVELFRYLAENRVEAPIVLVSGSDHRIIQSAARLAEAQGLRVLGTLAKPFHITDIAAILSSNMESLPAPLHPARNPITAVDLAAAIQNGEIIAYFQPQVDLQTKRIVGCEALARWQHSEWGMVFPDQFITIAETSGLIGSLTECIASHAIKQCAVLTALGINVHMSINVSALSLNDIRFPEKLIHSLEAQRVPPDKIVIEVTESGLFDDPVKTLDVLTRLRMKGVGLSIDDFGTGYSTFNQLQLIPFNELKIDKGFVMRCETDDESQSIVLTSIELAQRLGMRTVAEGVESGKIADRLWDWGCQTAQGYFYARPLPAAALLEFMKV